MVGLHYAAQGDHNEAVRIEAILHGMEYSEELSSDLVFSEREGVVWLGGKEGKIESDDGDHVFVGRDGRVVYLNEDYYTSRLHDYNGDRDQYNDYDVDYDDDVPTGADLTSDPYGDDPYFDDRGRVTTINKQMQKLKKKKPQLNMELAPPNVIVRMGLDPNIFKQIESKTPVFSGSYPPIQQVSIDMIEAFGDKISKEGFVPGTYGEPVVTKTAEELSLVKHLALFEDRKNTVLIPPSESEIDRVVFLCEKMLENNKYSPSLDYKKRSGIRSIIESTLVKGCKSAGFPYGADGLPTNSDVIRELGLDGLIDVVLSEWDNPFDLKAFLKTEPHKVSKIEAGLLRIITALPLHKMVKHQALFHNLTAAGVTNWRNSPLVFFSPQVPGDVENLWKRMKKRVFETDKSNWDFNMFDYIFEIVKLVIDNLIIKPLDMSDDDFDQYRVDVSNAIDEVFQNSVYRCSNGHRYQLDGGGIMKSGWVLTYFVNSISQLILHLLVSIRMGYTDVQILSEDMGIVVGGDDVLQSIPDDFDVDRCLFEYSQLGIKITQHKVHQDMNGAEFFSTEFWKHDDGIVRYKPVRFTKHIYNLRTTKPEFLCAALGSHMMNYCWDMSKFKIFESMFLWLEKYHPELVDKSLFKSHTYWRYKCKGCECV